MNFITSNHKPVTIGGLKVSMSGDQRWVLKASVLKASKIALRIKDVCLRLFLVDESGIIKATVFNSDMEQIESLHKLLHTGCHVAIANATITDPSAQDSSKARSLVMTINAHSLPVSNKELRLGSTAMIRVLEVATDDEVVELSNDETQMTRLVDACKGSTDAGQASMSVQICNIPTDCNQGSFLNVDGMIVKIFPVVYNSEPEGWRERRTIKIGDSSHHCIDMTLWDDFVEQSVREKWGVGTMLIIQDAKLSWYKGTNKLGSARQRTIVSVDQNPEAGCKIDRNHTWIDLSRYAASEITRMDSITAARTDNSLKIFKIKAQFDALKLGNRLWYTGCAEENCSCKVTLVDKDEENRGDSHGAPSQVYMCMRHGEADKVCYKYNFTVTIKDTHGATGYVTCFDAAGSQLLGYGLPNEPYEFPAQNFNHEDYVEDDAMWSKVKQLFEATKGDPDDPNWFELTLIRKEGNNGFVNLTLRDFLPFVDGKLAQKRKREEFEPYTGSSKQQRLEEVKHRSISDFK